MVISFYKYNGERNTVNKVLENPVNMDGKISEMSFQHPVVVVRGKVDGFTMCYIEAIGRYFFVESVDYVGERAFVNLACDVLMTFKDQILNATATLSSTDKPYKYDDNFKPVCDVRTEKEKIPFPNNGLNETGSIVMITIKGNI